MNPTSHLRFLRPGHLRLAATSIALALVPRAFAQQLQPPPPPPPGNPTTPSKVQLGRILFWDEQLSSTRTVACATCHMPESGGSDPRSSPGQVGNVHPGPDGLFGTPDDVRGSPGVVRSLADANYVPSPGFGLAPQVTPRKAPSAVNAAYAPLLFWDGRASGQFVDPTNGAIVFGQGAALESQAAEPPLAEAEMAHVGRDWNDVVQDVIQARPLALSPAVPASLSGFINGRSYPQIFQEVYGTTQVTAARILMAIAAYERTLFSNQAPLDQFNPVSNPNVLTPLEQQGAQLFASPQTSCNVCHAGPLLTNQTFRYIGVRPQNDDLGRFDVTGNPADRGRMRVPSLRNVELRAPYFHNGSMATIEDVIEFYNRGGDFNAPNKDPLIRPLNLTQQQKNALAAFLKRPLTDPRVAAAQPPFDHPALYAGSLREPEPFGAPTPGSGFFNPRMIALAPPLVGNGEFTVAVEHGRGGAFAGVIVDVVSNPVGAPFGEATSYLGMSSARRVYRVGPLNGFGPGNGWRSFVISLPNDPLLAGTPFYGQWFVLDSGSGGRFAATEAFSAVYFP